MIETFYSHEFQEALRKYEQARDGAGIPSTSFDSTAAMGLDDAVIDADVANLVAKASASMRGGFVRKVMGIFILQLAITAGVAVATATSTDLVKTFVDNPVWLLALWTGAFVLLIVLACVPGLVRLWPQNMIVLFLLTAVEGVILGLTAAVFDSAVVLVAIAATASACACVAIATLVDSCGLPGTVGAVLCISTTVATFAISASIGVLTSWGAIVGGLMVSSLFGVFIVWDVRAIVGGRHRAFDFELDEAVLAALCLYTDIVGLFMYAVACAAGSAARGSG